MLNTDQRGDEITVTAPLRLGLIGCGGIVQHSHLPALLALSDYAEVVALADPVEENCHTVGDSANVPSTRRHDNYRDLLAAGDLDLVIIATPHHLHAEQAIAAAEAGLGIISEKPMAKSSHRKRVAPNRCFSKPTTKPIQRPYGAPHEQRAAAVSAIRVITRSTCSKR